MFKKINDINVKGVNLPNLNTLPVRGKDISTDPFANFYICAKKNSGKTCLIARIIREMTDKFTRFVIICPTAEHDATYGVIIRRLRRRGCQVDVHTSLMNGKVSVFTELLNELVPQQEFAQVLAAPQQEESGFPDEDFGQEPEPQMLCRFDDVEPMAPIRDSFGQLLPAKTRRENIINGKGAVRRKKRKKTRADRKKKCCDICVIFDDNGKAGRHKSVGDWIVKNRHFKSLNLFSSQYPNDLAPQSFQNIDRFIAFQGHSKDKLKTIHEILDVSYSFENFLRLYKIATAKKYDFMYLNVRQNLDTRQNFNNRFLHIELFPTAES